MAAGHVSEKTPSPLSLEGDDFVCRATYPVKSFLDLIPVLSDDVCAWQIFTFQKKNEKRLNDWKLKLFHGEK